MKNIKRYIPLAAYALLFIVFWLSFCFTAPKWVLLGVNAAFFLYLVKEERQKINRRLHKDLMDEVVKKTMADPELYALSLDKENPSQKCH